MQRIYAAEKKKHMRKNDTISAAYNPHLCRICDGILIASANFLISNIRPNFSRICDRYNSVNWTVIIYKSHLCDLQSFPKCVKLQGNQISSTKVTKTRFWNFDFFLSKHLLEAFVKNVKILNKITRRDPLQPFQGPVGHKAT